MITLTLSKTNVYVLNTCKGYLLVDTGYEVDEEDFYKQLKVNNISPQDIKYIYLTHHHNDHSGLLTSLISKNEDIIVIMDENCAKLITQGENSRRYGGGWCSKRMKYLAELYRKINKEWNLSFPPYSPRENDIILNSYDNIFSGDAAANYLLWAGTKYAPAFVTDFKEFYKSWDKLLGVDAKLIYPSHGKPFTPKKLQDNIYKLSNQKMGHFQWD